VVADDELPVGGIDTAAMPEVKANLDALIEAYADARIVREEALDTVNRLRETEARLEARLFDEMEKLNVRSVRHARGLFILNDLAWADVTDEAAVRDWANAEMPEILLANRSKLATLVREALRGEREAMPPGVEPKFSRKINWRRS